jgi:hypothetical protein
MEGLRVVDEWSLIEGKITLDTMFRRNPGNIPDLTEEERDILSLVDGDNDVSAIIDISGKDDFSVSKTLVSLIERGAIEAEEVSPVITEISAREMRRPTLSFRFVPFVAIIIALVFSLLPVFLNTGQTLKRFLASNAVDAYRFKIETYTFEHGTYPETLDSIAKKTDPWGNPYIYRHNNLSFIVLSSGADSQEGTADDIY